MFEICSFLAKTLLVSQSIFPNKDLSKYINISLFLCHEHCEIPYRIDDHTNQQIVFEGGQKTSQEYFAHLSMLRNKALEVSIKNNAWQ